jgi:hypothetical protein
MLHPTRLSLSTSGATPQAAQAPGGWARRVLKVWIVHSTMVYTRGELEAPVRRLGHQPDAPNPWISGAVRAAKIPKFDVWGVHGATLGCGGEASGLSDLIRSLECILDDLSLRIANTNRAAAPPRVLWAAATGWDTECDGCMRWGCWRAGWGATLRRETCRPNRAPVLLTAGNHAPWPQFCDYL